MSDEPTTPDAEAPSTVAQTLHSGPATHVMARANIGNDGVMTYDVTAWVDGDADDVDRLKAEVANEFGKAGYTVTDTGVNSKSGNHSVEAQAHADDD